MKQVVCPGSNFSSGKIAEHSDIGSKNEQKIPPPGEVGYVKKNNGKAEQGGFFEFDQVFHWSIC